MRYSPDVIKTREKSCCPESEKVRAIIFVLFASVTSACTGGQIVKQEYMDNDPYSVLKHDFYHDLDPGEIKKGADLDGVLDEPPLLYYRNSSKIDLKRTSNSLIIESAESVLKGIQTEKNTAKERKIVLHKLLKASKLGLANHEAMMEIYSENEVINKQLILFWSTFENTARKLLNETSKLVELEAKVARTSGFIAVLQDDIKEIKDLVPLSHKDPSLISRHASMLNDYAGIVQGTLQPSMYKCEWNLSSSGNPSSYELLEYAKFNKEVAKLHLETALKKQQDYLAIQSYVALHKDKASVLKIYDQSKANKKIIDGWQRYVKSIDVFVKKILYVAKMESRLANRINRCDVKNKVLKDDFSDIEKDKKHEEKEIKIVEIEINVEARNAAENIVRLLGKESYKKVKKTAQMISVKKVYPVLEGKTKLELIIFIKGVLDQHSKGRIYATTYAVLHFLKNEVTQSDRTHIHKVFNNEIE